MISTLTGPSRAHLDADTRELAWMLERAAALARAIADTSMEVPDGWQVSDEAHIWEQHLDVLLARVEGGLPWTS